ncbi:MAG TPA: type II toxin-antitoxin system VapC family toxin [Acidimicrobiales bacterium]|nr:type II toxin-antitoxin system VapC family toxin [Acidimicrobiales bacterium]
MTPVVIDASAGAEMAADTFTGRRLRRLLPADAELWVPDLFYAECGSVLRKWERFGVLAADELTDAITELELWPLRMVGTRGFLRQAWQLRHNVTAADAMYVVLADHLGASLLTDDHRLVRAPNLPVPTLHL